MSSITVDAICRGELTLAQPRRGYRFNVDSLILADFVGRSGAPVERAVDLGAGCGVVGLLVARRALARQVLLVELQRELAELAADNIRRNKLAVQVRAVQGDLRTPAAWSDGPVDLLVSNPPFFRRASGRASPCPQLALARHEVACTLADLVSAARTLLVPTGSLVLIHVMDRLDELLGELERQGLAATLVQGVRPLPDRPANRVLVRAVREGDAGQQRLSDLVVETAPGNYTSELLGILGESAGGAVGR